MLGLYIDVDQWDSFTNHAVTTNEYHVTPYDVKTLFNVCLRQ